MSIFICVHGPKLFYRVGELYEFAMAPEHRKSISDSTVYDSTITDTGAISVSSGVRTGRSPKDKRTVLDEKSKDVSRSKHLSNSDCVVG